MNTALPLLLFVMLALFMKTFAFAQSSNATSTEPLNGITHSSLLTFKERSGGCVFGRIKQADASSVTVRTDKNESVILKRDDLLQVTQGNAPLFSGRSSWADVTQAHVLVHEKLLVKLKNGKKAAGKPVAVRADEITLRDGVVKNRFAKSEIATVDYVRVKPETNDFLYLAQEAPFLLFFDPEFYGRMAGLEGTVTVRLYDWTEPEDNSALTCATH
jgi:hypothetical protein